MVRVTNLLSDGEKNIYDRYMRFACKWFQDIYCAQGPCLYMLHFLILLRSFTFNLLTFQRILGWQKICEIEAHAILQCWLQLRFFNPSFLSKMMWKKDVDWGIRIYCGISCQWAYDIIIHTCSYIGTQNRKDFDYCFILCCTNEDKIKYAGIHHRSLWPQEAALLSPWHEESFR